jgi:hypothetical protein
MSERFEVLTAALMNFKAFRDVKSCTLLIIYRHFWVACYLSLHGNIHSSVMFHYFYESLFVLSRDNFEETYFCFLHSSHLFSR